MKQQPADSLNPVLITGGAGFIGTNVASRLLGEGRQVIIYDNFSRPGVEANLQWLIDHHRRNIRVIEGDVQDEERLAKAVAGCGRVFHFAAQVADASSLENPLADFETNARGTLNLLEAVRGTRRQIPVLYTSTNKVYGTLDDLALTLRDGRYAPADPAAAGGISEDRRVEFHGPNGCSKGAAEQYVLDYARTFGLQTVVFRISCIYGPHQFGTEDQDWVAHFLMLALQDQTITLDGDGRQVRDVLYVDDLVNAMLLAHTHIAALNGRAFNIGGGPDNTLSLLELTGLIGELRGKPPAVRFGDWRLADQRYYVSNINGFKALTGWMPLVPVRRGVKQLYHWLTGEMAPASIAESGRMIPVPSTRVSCNANTIAL